MALERSRRRRLARAGWLAYLCMLLTLAGLPAFASQATPPAAPAPRLEAPVDRSTPRATLEGFQRALRGGDAERAAQYLDLSLFPRSRRAADGPEIARELGLLIGWNLVLDPKKLSDDPQSDGDGTAVLGSLPLDGEPVPVSLARTRLPDGSSGWLFARTTVALVPALYEADGRTWMGDRVPDVLRRVSFLDVAAWQWIGLVLVLVAALALGVIGGSIITATAAWLARRHVTWIDEGLARAMRGPARLAIGVGAFTALLPLLQLDARAARTLEGLRNGVAILDAAWIALLAIQWGAGSLEGRLPEDTIGELRSRGVRTQIAVLRRIASTLVGLVAGAAVLMQFEVVRAIGASLLASAGIAGIVLGIAAQKTLGGVFAGIQVSIAQPIRIGDTVVVEGEFGTIEEMKFTHVVVRIWDERRLIVPTSRFLEQPFQNWTRMGSSIHGVVFLPADFTTPVGAVREELERICRDHPLWDGRTCSLMVTDATDRAITLRALVSAQDASKSFDLRCDVREKLVAFLQSLDGGAHLPKHRLDGADERARPAARVAEPS